MRSKVRLNKFEENRYCRNYFIKNSFCHTFPVIPKAQNYRECMETKKAIFRNSKEEESCTVYFALNFHTNL